MNVTLKCKLLIQYSILENRKFIYSISLKKYKRSPDGFTVCFDVYVGIIERITATAIPPKTAVIRSALPNVRAPTDGLSDKKKS